MSYLIGHQIEHYRIEAVLGDGGMGTVYRAYDLQHDRLVAIKVMHAHLANQPQFQRRFLQEANATRSFNSPHVIKVYQSGLYQDAPYMVMEYISGGSLTDYLKQLQWAGKRLALEEALGLAAQVAEGLSYAHQRGVIHRDIKPDNILLRLKDETFAGPRQAVISDFGLAVLLQEGKEVSTNPFMGSLAYMSPEQCSNLPLDGRSDLYSLGVMLYQLTTGQLPFRINAPADIVKHLQEMPLPPRLVNPDLTQEVEDLILKLMAKKPGERFQTGAEVVHKLRTIDVQTQGRETAVAAGISTGVAAVTQWVETRWVASVDVSSRIDTNRTWTSPGNYRLFIAHQWEEARIEALTGSHIAIGRHPDNQIVLDDRTVSAHHVRLERTPEGWQVVDLGSTNGTTLDGQELTYNQPVPWSSHQTLRIGPFALQWQAFSGTSAHAPERAQASVPAVPLPIVKMPTNGRTPATSAASPAPAMATVAAATAVTTVTPLPAINWDEISQSAATRMGETLEIALTPATLEVAPGAEAQMQLMVRNLGNTVEDVDLRLLEQGQPSTWMSLQSARIKLLPGESQMVALRVAPPPGSSILAGTHLFEVQAATSRGGMESITAQVQVARREAFALDMHPRNLQEKIVCRFAISDQSNFANVYEVEGQDDSAALNFNFAQLENATLVQDAPNKLTIRVQPGNTAVLPFTITPKKRPWFRRPERPFPFKVRVRTQTADWQMLDGQVAVSPRLSLRFLLLILFLLLLMLALGFFAVNRVQSEARNNAAATATAVRATLAVYEGEANSAQATADALRAAGDIAGAELAQATADALRATLVAQNLELDQVAAQLAITPTPVPVPIDIILDNFSVPENADIGTTVGTFIASFAGGQSHSDDKPRGLARLAQQTAPRITFSLVAGSGDRDNSSFFIEGAVLKTAARFDFETQSSYSLRVRADNGAGGIFEKAFSISVIDRNDTPAFSISDVTVSESAGKAIITINMTNDSNSVVSVDVSTADGTAKAGEDYTAFEGTVSWRPGETGRKTVEIAILDDQVDEPDETFSVRLSNPVIGVIATGTAVVTITDDDDPPTLSIADAKVTENGGRVTLTVTMSGLSSQEVSVAYATADGTARANEDYAAASGTLTWKARETGAKTFTVTILDDQIHEPNETFRVNLSNAVNATLATGTATVTIEEDDPPPVLSILATLAVSEPPEADGNAFLAVTMERASSAVVTVNYATSDDTAVKGRDYVETSGTLTWQPGETGVKSFPVVIKADRIFEPADEVFIVTLSNPTNATLGNAVARVSITDSDERPTVQVLDNIIVTEGSGVRARIQVRLNGGSSTAVSVTYVTEEGTAKADQDYRPPPSTATLSWAAEEADTIKEIFIDLIDDRIYEPQGETFHVLLTGVTTNNAVLATQNRATVTINDNDPPPQLQLRTESVNEGDGQVQIQVRLLGGSYENVPVTVAVSNGTATAGLDFLFNPVPDLVFPANEVDRTLTFPVAIIDDEIFEPGEAETFVVTLTPDPDTNVAALSGNVRIVDNDSTPSLQIQNTPLAVTEGTGSAPTLLTVTVMLVGGFNAPVTAVINTEDITARAPQDYVAITNQPLIFPANVANSTRAFAVQIVADAIDEGTAETFRVRLTVPTQPDIGGANEVITINDDDSAGLVVSASSVALSEGGSGVPYTIRLNSVPTDTVTVTIDPDDQVRIAPPLQQPAPPGAPVQVTFLPNNSALSPQTVTAFAADDSLAEGPHTGLIMHITGSADPRYQGRTHEIRATITDDDLPPLIPPGQSREVSEDAPAGTLIGAPVLAQVRSTAGVLQNWTITAVSPVTATNYFAINSGSGQLSLTAAGAGNLDREGPQISFTLTLTVADGFNLSEPETVVINLLDANDVVPVIPPQTRQVAENSSPGPFDAPLTAVDGDVTPTIFQNWTILSVSPPAATTYFAISTTLAGGGQLALTADGAANIDFETPPNTYLLQVTVSDGVNISDPQTITVNVLDANDPPVAVDDSYNVVEDVTFNQAEPGVLANDFDVDAAGDMLTVVAVNGSAVVGQSILLPSGALLTLNANGSLTYDTNGAYDALAIGEIGSDSFAYTVSDGNGGTDTATVTLTITGTNDNPTAVADTGAVLQNEVLTVAAPGVLGNDTDPDTPLANLSVTAVNGVGANVGVQITLASGALLTLNANGSYTYNPNGAFDYLAVGETTTDNFTYTVSDGVGGSSIGPVTITITGVNDPPTAVNDTGATNEDTSLLVPLPGVLANDTDPDGDALTVTAVNGSGASVGVPITLPSGALLTLNANGSYTYNPNGAFDYLAVAETTTDNFTYTVSDGNGGSDIATVTITITGVNDPPTAVADSGATDQNTTLFVPAPGVLANDFDIDTGDTLFVTAVSGSLPSGALRTLNANGSYSYNPNGAFNHLPAGVTGTDQFSYTVNDPHGGSDSATVTITITGTNDAPVLGSIAATRTYTEGGSVLILAPTGVVTDADMPANLNGILTVELIANGTTDDRLAIHGPAMPGNYSFNVGLRQIRRDGSVVIGNYNNNPAAWPTPLIITFTASATPADIQVVLRAIAFSNVVNSPGLPNPSTLPRSVRFTLTDNLGATSNQPIVTVNVVAVRQPGWDVVEELPEPLRAAWRRPVMI